MEEMEDGLGGPSAAAELNIQLRPVGSLSANVKLPGREAKELLRTLMVTVTMVCVVAGPALVLCIGALYGVPIVVTVGVSILELGAVGFIFGRKASRTGAASE
ncbi:hypothetical protein GCM10010260_49340 [Streptomyces filipinensis]|uniref:Uncharacterized protein n=1 Tax=Streptomyces filipinensis TaxID=66887 RepID=A0A918IFW6_9ACTN|nr:hypothetical protein [Streptomyces filipinensis]GGV06026.1 hypothetical protein GCM10010260_49340 [Streptomyces filipinensis]